MPLAAPSLPSAIPQDIIPPAMRVLLVEDDAKFSRLTAEFLQKHGHEPTVVADGEGALDLLRTATFDVILLDVMLPGLDGFEVARRIRETSQAPLLMVTARGEDEDTVTGLDAGADDYLAKPFNGQMLLARIRAVVRRAQPPQPPPPANRPGLFEAPGLRIHPAERQVLVDGEPCELTAQEMELLLALARHAGQVLSREQLLDLVKGPAADEAFDRAIDVQMSRLRKKIEKDPRTPRFLKTVRGLGYMLSHGD